MQIWLPPSEGKTAPTAGPPLDLSSLSLPGLAPARQEVKSALESLGAGEVAARTLGLGPNTAREAEANLLLDTSPTAPADQVYTGVLFDALDPSTLTPQARTKLKQTVLIASALFGFVGPDDRIPNHRLSIGVNLPPLGPLGRWWRPHLRAGLRGLSEGPVLDARSGPYRTAYPARDADVLLLNVQRELDGRRQTVSHQAKRFRGLAVRALLLDPLVQASSETAGVLTSLEGFAESVGGALEVAAAKATRQGGTVTDLTLVVPADL